MQTAAGLVMNIAQVPVQDANGTYLKTVVIMQSHNGPIQLLFNPEVPVEPSKAYQVWWDDQGLILQAFELRIQTA
jgi:hypothetical protein